MSSPAGCKVLKMSNKGHFLTVPPGATQKCLQQAWLCGGTCPPLCSLRDVEQSSHQLSPSLPRGEGEQDMVGLCCPCWALLINIRNSTRGCEASNQSVISYMGFAKCLSSPDNKREPQGQPWPWSCCVTAEPPRALSAALPAPGLCWDVWNGQIPAPCPGLPAAQTSLSSLLQLI